MGFEKTYRKRSVWGSHGKRTGVNERLMRELERQSKRIRRLEAITFPLFEKERAKRKLNKKRKQAKWGRNK